MTPLWRGSCIPHNFLLNFPSLGPDKSTHKKSSTQCPSRVMTGTGAEQRDRMSMPETVQLVGRQPILGGAKYFQPASRTFPLGIKEEQRAGRSVQRSSAQSFQPDFAAAAGRVPACPPTGAQGQMQSERRTLRHPFPLCAKGKAKHMAATPFTPGKPGSTTTAHTAVRSTRRAAAGLAQQHSTGPACARTRVPSRATCTKREQKRETVKYHTGHASWFGS